MAKYDYNSAINLICKSFDENTNVTYEALEKAIGLEQNSIANNDNMARGAVSTLRKHLKEEKGLTIHTACSGRNTGPEYYHYAVSKVKTTTIEKKKNNKDTVVITSNAETSINALRKDNEKLYQELEDAKSEIQSLIETIDNLSHKCNTMSIKEREYKRVIASLQMLLSLSE